MTVDLIIAGRMIRLQSDDGITLRPDDRFSSFIAAVSGNIGASGSAAEGPGEADLPEPELTKDTEVGLKTVADPGLTETPGPELTETPGPELTVDVFPGRLAIPADAKKVFDARLMEEAPDGPRDTGEPFWEILTGEGMTFAKVYLKDPVCNPVLVMPDGKKTWQIFADSQGPDANPLPYPLDGLLLYFLSSAAGDIMIHGSGTVCGGRGWIFTGRSGSGKTTVAGIFDRAGDRVIHDDRLILRKEEDGWVMHSTPVYRNDEPRSAAVDRLWSIAHGRSNISTPVTGAEAVAMVMSNCVQQNRDREAALRLAAAVEELVSSVRVSRLSFMPDGSLRDYLIARESGNAVTAAEAASAILAGEKPVTITAGGYSMWPAIRPGDRIVIMPYDHQIPLAKGMVVALRRDGGFVVHRVTDYRRGQFMNFIRTRGDAGIIYDPWVPTGDVAGLVKKVTEDNKTIMISPQRMPYYIGSLAVALIKIWDAIRRRF
ncbi:MAG: hypothetical protein IH592_07575 [Bacteroidales bacterium]|nr:hypothetical protein [Bacteroidales bacterium]